MKYREGKKRRDLLKSAAAGRVFEGLSLLDQGRE